MSYLMLMSPFNMDKFEWVTLIFLRFHELSVMLYPTHVEQIWTNQNDFRFIPFHQNWIFSSLYSSSILWYVHSKHFPTKTGWSHWKQRWFKLTAERDIRATITIFTSPNSQIHREDRVIRRTNVRSRELFITHYQILTRTLTKMVSCMHSWSYRLRMTL